MKKYLSLFTSLTLLFIATTACIDDDQTFGALVTPTDLNLQFEIVGADANNPNGDGSGLVTFTVTANDAITYRFNFGDATDVKVAPSGTITHRFSKTGVHTYIVTAIASGKGGVSSSKSVSIDVFSAFDDQEAKQMLTGGSTKTWYLAAAEPGHLGVGPSLQLDLQIFGTPSQFYFPSFFASSPFEKCNDPISSCLCNDELTFTLNANNQLTFELNNNGQTFFNVGHQDIVGGSVGEDACFDFDTSGTKNVALAPTTVDWSLIPDPNFETPRGTVMNFSDGGFMGYYVSSSSYEIMSISDTELYVRTIDGLDPNLAWYHKYTSEDTGNSLETIYNTLIWEDDFNTNGAPNPANWTYDIGTGNNGWGNNEAQYYTDRPENVVVEDGLLKITAQAENFNGRQYTSARIKSENLFEFNYGRVEIRAKMPEGGGTWPALWMLGSNFSTVGWPESGEIDIMEHIGNTQNTIYGTLHYPNGNGGVASSGDTTVITNASSNFHTYTLEWKPDEILFAVDDELYFTFPNDGSLPFNQDFFLIMNVAMGGTFGGEIDPNFNSSTLEVDYVRVYQ